MASNLTIRPLNTGFIPTKPLQYHFHFSAEPYLKDVPDEKIPLPDYAFLVEGGDRLVLVDTGMSWTERANEYHHPGSWRIIQKSFLIFWGFPVRFSCDDSGEGLSVRQLNCLKTVVENRPSRVLYNRTPSRGDGCPPRAGRRPVPHL